MCRCQSGYCPYWPYHHGLHLLRRQSVLRRSLGWIACITAWQFKHNEYLIRNLSHSFLKCHQYYFAISMSLQTLRNHAKTYGNPAKRSRGGMRRNVTKENVLGMSLQALRNQAHSTAPNLLSDCLRHCLSLRRNNHCTLTTTLMSIGAPGRCPGGNTEGLYGGRRCRSQGTAEAMGRVQNHDR